ncbi:MAG: hypothetical protein ABIP30_12265 [Ferruginibacter sp.]
MAKKDVIKKELKTAMKQQVEKKLASLLIKLDPEMEEKKIRKKIKLSEKILLKGIKTKKTVAAIKKQVKKDDAAD